ncbi:MAG: hypothetical protein ACOCV2_08580 [Persicimonas sp.]
MNGSAKLWLLPALLLVAVGLISFAAQLWWLSGDVEQSDWRAPAEYVLEHIGPEDAINVQPHWTDDPYPYLTEVGDQILRQQDPLLEDAHRYERIWLLTETDRLDEAIERMPFAPVETREFGAITVVRLDAPSSSPVATELLSELDEATVERVGDGDERTCNNYSERDRAWYCGKRSKWIYVGEEFLHLGRDPHRCIWAHPLPNGRTHRITFPDVKLSERFRLRAGLAERAARSKRGTDIDLRLTVGEEFEKSKTIPARESSWEPIDFDTSSKAGERRDVVVEVSSPDVKDRFFCFNGWVFDEAD